MEILERIKNIILNFTDNNTSIAIAESCTGGYISHMITNISGSSKVFERGIVCYSNNSKVFLLNIDPKNIENYGAVSEVVAKELAYNVRILSNVDIGVGITGIAGPTGGTPAKPVGLVYIAFSTDNETIANKYNFEADRLTFKEKVLEKVIELLEKV